MKLYLYILEQTRFKGLIILRVQPSAVRTSSELQELMYNQYCSKIRITDGQKAMVDSTRLIISIIMKIYIYSE